MSDILVTDPPDPDCYICDGRGVVGGCPVCRDLYSKGYRQPSSAHRSAHQHTYSFCRCVNERMEVTDDE